jgi:formyl-CoA transferase
MTGDGHFPLSKIKVLDLTRARAGPTCVRQLVDWGADAIKIEMPGGRAGDGMGGNRHGFDFQNLHRNKRSISLNLKHPKGVGIFKALAKEADVIVENYRADVKHRLGIDYDTIKAINPRIIYGSISGFGQEGPYRDRPGVDQIAQGLGGLMSITGLPGQGPVRVGIPISDLCAGIFLAQGILVALYERETTGIGKWVSTSLLESMISMLDFQGSRWTMAGEVAPQAGNNHPTGIPTNAFETQNGYINIAASGDDLYRRLCRACEREDLLTDERFSSSKARYANRELMNETINTITKQRPSEEWIKLLNEAGVPCGPINSIDKTFADDQVQFLEMAQKVNSPELGELTVLGHPVSFNGKRNPLQRSAPELGQDNEAVLIELGFDKNEVANLEKDGVI